MIQQCPLVSLVMSLALLQWKSQLLLSMTEHAKTGPHRNLKVLFSDKVRN